MAHPYRPEPVNVTRPPWWRRALCVLGLHRSEPDAARGIFVCFVCGRERRPHCGVETIRVIDARDRRAVTADRERYEVEHAAWRGGTGPKPKPPIPAPGRLVRL